MVYTVQLIDMLDRRVKTQHEMLVQYAMTSARTNEMQLETDVLRTKLAHVAYVSLNRITVDRRTFPLLHSTYS